MRQQTRYTTKKLLKQPCRTVFTLREYLALNHMTRYTLSKCATLARAASAATQVEDRRGLLERGYYSAAWGTLVLLGTSTAVSYMRLQLALTSTVCRQCATD